MINLGFIAFQLWTDDVKLVKSLISLSPHKIESTLNINKVG